MSNNSNAVPAPENNSGVQPTPNLTVVPPPKPKRVVLSLNKAQSVTLSLTDLICVEAKKPDAAPTLENHGISAAFVTALQARITAVRARATTAIACTGAGEAATAEEEVKKTTLVRTLRQVQQAAKQLHQFTDPAQLHGYLVGEPITQSRPILEQSAETIISRGDAERPPGIDTGFIDRATAERIAYQQSQAPQVDEQAQAKEERALRDAEVRVIKQECKQIQLAADSAWPPRVDTSVGFRKRFRLPSDRPLPR